MCSDVVIDVAGLSKCHLIFETPHDRLKQFLLPRLIRMAAPLLGLFRRRPLRVPKYYREFWALKDVSFQLRKGETVGIVGHNGSGKSTLLQLICGTLSPTAGDVRTNGRIAALLELGSGFNPDFTGRENVYMNGVVLGLTTNEIDARFDKIAEFADIGEFIDQPIKTYSSGMMMRLAFAVIAHVDADILVIDEALAVGDAFFTQKCMRFLRNFMKTGTVLFVSHDTSAVVNLCSKAILLNHGEIVEVGTPKRITQLYLSSLYEAVQDVDGVAAVETTDAPVDVPLATGDYRDMRESLINGSTLRNYIEIFRFKPDESGFGAGGARISSVRLLDRAGAPFSWVVGGEDIVLEIRCEILNDLDRPIIGFELKDRLGQVIFGDNTFLTYHNNPVPVSRGAELVARFDFRLPVLHHGDYSVTAAIADGSQESHVQHHWMHDALIIRVRPVSESSLSR